MNNQLTIATLGDTVRERVKSAIFSAIPDEAVEALIAGEFARMTDKSEEEYINNQRVRLSPLQKIIAAEIKTQLSNRMKEDVTKYIDQTYQNQSKELVQGAIKELAPIFMASMCERFAAMAVQDIRNQLSQKGLYL